MDSTTDEWELCNDDGFIYKRKKRRLDDPPAPQLPDPEAEDRERRDRKRKALLNLKTHYQKEIDHWDFLSNTLRALQDNTHLKRHQDFREMESFLGSASKLDQDTQVGCGSLVDDLLLQAEAQEAIIHDVSNLCDVAEAMCNAQEEWVTQSLVDLPVWASPRELMASLCDE
ncbi:hypothetical protein ACOSP7_001863 [Xanthoceras sorbifolium]|uniref:Uncharacterized protein n=1 Tax=Xanthoceras sorbifolium TaxID=99658 RepID=A0ABQ8IMD5_9ROSI|nr:hypothetical protein JRO89_XS01G0231900 [Xanthoceras sorbifolium]